MDAKPTEESFASLQVGDRIEVWTESGECFEARFYLIKDQMLIVGDKWYGSGHHRGEGLRGDRLEYPLQDIKRVDLYPEARSTRTRDLVITAVAAAAITLLFLATSFASSYGTL